MGNLLFRFLSNPIFSNGILIFLTILFLSYYFLIDKKQSLKKYFWLVAIIYFFASRSFDFALKTLNPDEEQWIVSAESLISDIKGYYYHYYLIDFTRILTILPLALFGIFTDFLSYGESRLLNISLIIFSIYLGSRILKNTYSEKTSLFVAAFFIIVLGNTSNIDIISYNSELPAIVFFLSAVLLFEPLYKKNISVNKIKLFLSGFLLAVMPFAKEQAGLIAIFSFAFFLTLLLKNKQKYYTIYLIAGGIIGSGLFLIPYFIQFNYHLVFSLLENNLNYSRNGLNQAPELSAITNIFKFTKLIWLNPLYIIAGILTLSGISLCLIEYIRNKNIKNFEVLFIFIFLITLKSIYVPNNMFYHYTIFLWPVFFVFIGLFYHSIEKYSFNHLKGLSVICIAYLTISFSFSFIKPYPFFKLFDKQTLVQNDPLTELIIKNSEPNDKMIIWGWANSFYLTTKLKRGCTYLYPQHTTKNYPGSKYVIDIYYQDLIREKPKIILQLVCKDCFYFNDKSIYSIESVSTKLFNYINLNYELVESDPNFLLYKLKDK
jgi:hypothetical protein